MREHGAAGRAALIAPVVVLGCALLMAAAWAQPHVERPDELLSEARSATAVRAALIAHARSVRKASPPEAADALLYAGESFERSSLPDSAAICYREAAALRGSNVAPLALADLLMLRARAADLLEAYRVVGAMVAGTPVGAHDRADVMMRSMWLQHLAGHPDSAAAAYREVEGHRGLRGIWALRAARVLIEDVKNPGRAGELLLPLEIQSRGQDAEVHDLLIRSAAAFGRAGEDVARAVDEVLRRRDAGEETLLNRLDARRLPLWADDGFLLSSVVRPAPPGAPAAVVLAMGDTLAHYDSLIVHLHESGFAVILVEPRGHGLSVGPPCPNPLRWELRQHEMEERLALDAAVALGALGEAGPVDTAHAIVVGVGFTARAAVRAAELRSEFRGIVLASAEPARVDRGMMIASVERTRTPTFLQTAPEDLVDLYYFADALYQAGDRKTSRVSSGTAAGRYAEQFNNDPRSGTRLRQWLAELRLAWKR
jgi:hypothetical protein